MTPDRLGLVREAVAWLPWISEYRHYAEALYETNAPLWCAIHGRSFAAFLADLDELEADCQRAREWLAAHDGETAE